MNTNAKPQAADAYMIAGDHYLTMGVTPWMVIDCWPIEQQIGFHRGSALAYLMRMGTKDEALQEARKAQHYMLKLIEILERGD